MRDIISLVPPHPSVWTPKHLHKLQSQYLLLLCRASKGVCVLCVLAEGRSPLGLSPWPPPSVPCPRAQCQLEQQEMGCLTGLRERQGHWGTGEGRREIRQRGFHMVGFAINFECFCGSIKFPRVVYKEYELRKLVAKTG